MIERPAFTIRLQRWRAITDYSRRMNKTIFFRNARVRLELGFSSPNAAMTPFAFQTNQIGDHQDQ